MKGFLNPVLLYGNITNSCFFLFDIPCFWKLWITSSEIAVLLFSLVNHFSAVTLMSNSIGSVLLRNATYSTIVAFNIFVVYPPRCSRWISFWSAEMYYLTQSLHARHTFYYPTPSSVTNLLWTRHGNHKQRGKYINVNLICYNFLTSMCWMLLILDPWHFTFSNKIWFLAKTMFPSNVYETS
jgi:hypothetical protein